MAEADLFHRISTHAVSGPFDTTGLRSVELDDRDAARVLPPEILADLDDLLRKTSPAGSATGYVVRRYAAGHESFVCVVATYPDLVQDAQGRDGVLTHARVVRIDPSQDVWRDVPALVEAVAGFPIGDICAVVAEERLAAYLDLVSGETTVTLHPLSVVELQQVPGAFLADFLAAVLATIGDKSRTRFVVSLAAVAEQLATAWCALPAMLQRRSSYAVGVGEGCPVDAIFSTTSGRSPADVAGETLVRYVKQYVTLLSDAPDAVDSILRNAAITDVSKFGQAIDRATVATPRWMASGKGTMPKKDKPRTAGRDELDALDPEVVAELNRQFEALEDEMRMLINQRIEDLEARNVLATRQGRVPFWKDARVWSPLLVALIAIGTFAWLWPRGVRNAPPADRVIERADRTSTEDETPPPVVVNDTVDPEQAVLTRVVTSAAATQLWADAFKELVSNDGAIVTRFISVAMNDSEVESDATVRELQTFAKKIAGRQDLRPEGRERLRALLLDYIAKQVASADGIGAQVKVDGDLRDVKAILDRVKLRAGVKSTELDVNGNHLQSEIILRWMESHPR